MTEATKTTIIVDANAALSFIRTAMPIVEAIAPRGAAAGPVGAGVSAVALLLPLLAQIPVGTVVSVEEQASLRARMQAIVLLDFSGPQWQVPK